MKIDNFPRKSMNTIAKSVEVHGGGSAANTAIAASRLGAKTLFIGKIGKDTFGSFLRNEFIKDSINIESLAMGENERTGITIFLISSNGERAFIGCRGANKNLKSENVKEETIISSNVLPTKKTESMPLKKSEIWIRKLSL